MFQLDEEHSKFRANIKVVGVGGGGCNAVKTMHRAGLSGVQFISANTDLQVLEEMENTDCCIQLGAQLTKGLGAGANPEVGRQAAIESCDEIVSALKGADMVFITAGMGGGTGTGGAGVIARLAKEQGSLTVGVVTRPFFFEGQRRSRHAETGIQFLKENVDTLIVIPNQKLLKTSEKDTSLLSAFKSVDNILLRAVKGIVDLINQKGLINLDFADVKTVMSEKGLAIIGTGSAKGEDRAVIAAGNAVSSPLLEDTSFKGASGLIINITGGPDLSLKEVNQTAELISAEAHPDAEIIFGAIVDPNESSGEVKVTVIATGFEGSPKKEQRPTGSNSSIAHTGFRSASIQSSPHPGGGAKMQQETRQEGTQYRGKEAPSPVTQAQAPPLATQPQAQTQQKPGTKLLRDILIEKARDYQNKMNEKHKNQNPAPSQQLSMNISNQKKEAIAKKPHKPSSPFHTDKAGGGLMNLFKKSEKTF